MDKYMKEAHASFKAYHKISKERSRAAKINFWILFLGVFIGIATCVHRNAPVVPVYTVPADTVKVDTVHVDSIPKVIDTADVKVTTHVHLTCYQPVKSQCDSDPLVTADGSRINLQQLKNGSVKWVAVSPDLLWLFPMGSTVRITSEKTGKVYGEYQIRDKMNRRLDHCMDILIHPDSEERFSERNVRVELV